jgi:NRPS condensation-like uncharacterized protein
MVNLNRNLGLVEHLFETLHSMGGMLYVNIVKIQGELSLDILRPAIDLLQKRQPLLQVHLQKTNDGFYFCKDGTLAIPLRIVKRQHEQQWLDVVSDELRQPFADKLEPLCRITLLQSSEQPGSHELIVTFHHAIADGISAIHCIHELLSYYQELIANGFILPVDSLRLLPPLEQLLETYLSEGDVVTRTQVTTSQTNPSPTLIIEQMAAAANRQTCLLPRELNQDLTSKLISRCRNEQTTVHGALCAAMLLACVQHLSSAEPILISCGSNVNLRTFCVPFVDPGYLGCFVSSATTIHHVDLNTAFWDLARECYSNLHQLIHNKVPHFQVSNAELLNKYQPLFLTQLAEHNMGRNTTIHISNLGQSIFEESYDSMQLKSFHFATGQAPIGACFWLGAVTINQKLCCTFTYTEPLISMKTAESLTDFVTTILDRETS